MNKLRKKDKKDSRKVTETLKSKKISRNVTKDI